MRGEVWILLATFNGAQHLSDLIESVRAQTLQCWRLLVRDDGSSDDSLSLIHDWAEIDDRIHLCSDTLGRLGVTGSFSALLCEAKRQGAEYFALCDQDDVWLPHKLSTLKSMMDASSVCEAPSLAYSDLKVVNDRLDVINPSFFKMSHAGRAVLVPGFWLLLQNLVPGCTMMGNRALLERCAPIPEQAVIHDWWILLCASSMGQVIAVPEPLILYRQHGANTIGAESYPRKALRLLLNWWAVCRQKRQLFLASMKQNMALVQRLSLDVLCESTWRKEIEQLPGGLLSHSRWRRIRALLFGKVKRVGWARNLLLLCVLLTLRSRESITVTTSGRGSD